jgi:hypothetical protein
MMAVAMMTPMAVMAVMTMLTVMAMVTMAALGGMTADDACRLLGVQRPLNREIHNLKTSHNTLLLK